MEEDPKIEEANGKTKSCSVAELEEAEDNDTNENCVDECNEA